jgi:phage tail protein X
MASIYVTKQGDTFDSIAFKQLGDEAYIKQLMAANPDYLAVIIFSGGITLTIPDIDDSDTASTDPPWA